MKTRLVLFSSLLFISLLEIGNASPANAVIKVMPLGDSITQGYIAGVNEIYWTAYRKALYNLLTTDGYNVDFVGSQNDGSYYFDDPDNEGHSGWQAYHIENGKPDEPGAGKLQDWLNAEQPDIILLHIGTNDIVDRYITGYTIEEMVGFVKDILDEIDQYENENNVNITVILALIINEAIGCSPEDSAFTTDFNNLLSAMATDRITNPANPAYPDKIEIVDMENDAGFTYQLDVDMQTCLHPNDSGYTMMADAWYPAVIDAIRYPKANAGPDQHVIEGDTVSLDASNSSDLDGSIVSYQWTQTSGPTVELSDSGLANPTFTAPNVESAGETLTFKVTVTDNEGQESIDTVQIYVSAGDELAVDFGTLGLWHY